MVTFSISATDLLGPLIATILPLIVAYVTKESADGTVKAMLLTGLSILTNVLTGIQDAIVHHGQYDLGKALILSVSTFAIALAVHLGIWKPTGVTAHLQKRGIHD